MKRMKKLFAILMTMAMVMGLGITGFAATDATHGSITVTGLVKENTKIEVYQVLKADADVNEWVVNGWAKEYVTENAQTNEYTFDWDELYNHLPNSDTDNIYWTQNTSTGECTFWDLPIGAYLIKVVLCQDLAQVKMRNLSSS